MPITESRYLIPSHHFGFRAEHSTIDQVHRITHKIHTAFEKKQVCSAVFLDVSQAFDRAWHQGVALTHRTATSWSLILMSAPFELNMKMHSLNLSQLKPVYPKVAYLDRFYTFYTRVMCLLVKTLQCNFC